MVRINLKAILLVFAVMTTGVLGGCAGGGSSTPATVAAPVVILTNPVNDATGVLLTEPVSVAFSKTMQLTAFTSATFTVTSGNNSVSGTISYANGYATLTPSAPMFPSTRYTATIAAGVQASDGGALAAPYSWSFTTGPLDPGFGNGGVVITPISMTLGDGARAVAVQTDGKVVAVGYVDKGNGDYDFVVARYNTDGSLDTSFGGDGIVTTVISSGRDEARAVVIQGDGKIVVAGSSFNGRDTDFVVARYNPDGSLDTVSFNSSGPMPGVVATNFGSGDEAFAIAIQSTAPNVGKIVVVGHTGSLINAGVALARYNVNGTLDTTFGTNGLQTTFFGDGFDAAYAVAIQDDDKIVVAGITDSAPGTGINNDFALARYDADGVLDIATFGNSGKVITPVGAADEGAFAIGIQTGGKIVVAGGVFNGSNNDFGLVRYDINGVLDATFGGGDGIVITDMAGGNDAALALVVQPDNKIVVAGTAFVTNQGNDFAMARYNPNGDLDVTFDADGKVITNIGATHDTAYGLVLRPDGKVVLVGSTGGTGDGANFVLVGFSP